MSVAVVNVRKEPVYRRQAIETGLKRLGYTLATGIDRPRSKADLLVLWNKKKGSEEQAANRWEQHGGTVIVMENGYLAQVEKTYYAISVHGHNGSGWFPNLGDDRYSKLGFPIKPMREIPTGEWIVRSQRGIGSTLMASPPQWGEKMLAKLQAQGKRARLIQHPGNFAPKVPPIRDLAHAHRFMTWASAMGVLALVEGIDVLHSAPRWICENWTYPGGREAALQHMAHGQWHFSEIATGEPFKRILDNLEQAKW